MMPRIDLTAADRRRVVEIAAGNIGAKTAADFWDVCGAEPFSSKLAWCGIFALHCLHAADVAPPEIKWEFGRGFLYHLPPTTTPQPGDIGYIHHPFQHHLIVESVDGDTVTSIDGNTPIVARKKRAKRDITTFYSIEDWIYAAHARRAYP